MDAATNNSHISPALSATSASHACTLMLARSDVERLLTVDECISAVEHRSVNMRSARRRRRAYSACMCLMAAFTLRPHSSRAIAPTSRRRLMRTFRVTHRTMGCRPFRA